jgi:hypothetical protein
MPRFQYPLEVHGLQTILDEGVKAEDLEVKDLLLFILAELKTMNEHLTIITDEEIDTDDNLEV